MQLIVYCCKTHVFEIQCFTIVKKNNLLFAFLVALLIKTIAIDCVVKKKKLLQNSCFFDMSMQIVKKNTFQVVALL